MLLEDVEYFLEKTKAKECFDMLDLDRDGKISLQVDPCCMLRYDLCRMLRYDLCRVLRYDLCRVLRYDLCRVLRYDLCCMLCYCMCCSNLPLTVNLRVFLTNLDGNLEVLLAAFCFTSKFSAVNLFVFAMCWTLTEVASQPPPGTDNCSCQTASC